MKANIFLSLGVALTGIAAPIALSFVLRPLTDASALQCFAAGAALCSTSLGTTFAVLRSSKLTTTRLGVVLTSAAMLDDVAGLVMVQVVSNLSSPGASVSVATVLRPVLVSAALAVIAMLACRFMVLPVTIALNKWRVAHPTARLASALRYRATALFLYTALLLGLVTGASYAGTSNLFAAYIAGAAISWWDSELAHVDRGQTEQPPDLNASLQPVSTCSGYNVFEEFYSPALRRILQPFFFASIGFSIPLTRLFSASTWWKGVVYSILMATGKIFCGAWLVRIPATSLPFAKRVPRKRPEANAAQKVPEQSGGPAQGARQAALSPERTLPEDTATTEQKGEQPINSTPKTDPSPAKPVSLYPALIVGCAMVARGEIGFLISAVAQSSGIFDVDSDDQTADSEVFLVTIWAIVLCTVLGPLCLGILVRRLRKLEHDAATSGREGGGTRREAVLGVWGVH